ncbi:MAG: class I mannose-6-phosphate isomerase [Fuerstiella sp.]|nr:class I mannose-6-phosphate isomerase [Fuerstiella sp.]
MTPLTFVPLFKRIRWGGRRLGELLDKDIGPETDYAESWEIADHGTDQSIVANGPESGKTLRQLMYESETTLLGRHAGLDQFPLLIKFLDANDWLSLQVHPNDEQAKHYGCSEQGKTEAWIIIDAQPDSQICAGLKSGVGRDQLSRHLQNGTIEQCLNLFHVRAGDCVFVPAGTVHAIGPGIVLAEIQQQSDLTFRLHDWGRRGTDGKPREIHVKQSFSCTDFRRGPVRPVVPSILSSGEHVHEELVRNHYFVVQRHITDQQFRIPLNNQFHILMVLHGNVGIDSSDAVCSLARGSTMLIPAAIDSVLIKPDERSTILDIFLP